MWSDVAFSVCPARCGGFQSGATPGHDGKIAPMETDVRDTSSVSPRASNASADARTALLNGGFGDSEGVRRRSVTMKVIPLLADAASGTSLHPSLSLLFPVSVALCLCVPCHLVSDDVASVLTSCVHVSARTFHQKQRSSNRRSLSKRHRVHLRWLLSRHCPVDAETVAAAAVSCLGAKTASPHR